MVLPDDFNPEVARFRELLRQAGLSMRAAAKELGMPRDKLRKYTEAKRVIPEYLWLAVERLVERKLAATKLKEK